MLIAFSDEWARAWGRALNDSSEYGAAAATWEGSVVAAAVDPSGSPPLAAAFLDLWHGRCLAARSASTEDHAGARYVLEGTPAAWKDLFSGRLAPLMALLGGRIQLARGELATLLPFAGAARELVRLAGSVPADFPTAWISTPDAPGP